MRTHQSTPSRQQFVRLCECGCGQPTLLATYTSPKSGSTRGQPLRFLPRHHIKGTTHPRYKGRTISGGYAFIFVPDHPYANKHGCVQEHRLVVERLIGRYLRPEEVVHHDNEDKQDNRPENLILCDSNGEHLRLHHTRSTGAICARCGDPARRVIGRGLCRRCYKRWWTLRPERGWRGKYTKCVECGRSDRYHEGDGLCHNCYARRRKRARRSAAAA
jgi:hypothetical protein